jgi:hypothetical protein
MNEPATDADLEPDMLRATFVAKMDAREHYQADDLMKSIKAQRKPSAECILMVVSLPPPGGYRLSEAAAALNAAGVLALPYIVPASTPKSNTPRGGGKFELAARARKRKMVFLRKSRLNLKLQGR